MFYDERLKGESSVQVTCGPEQYRFTVTTHDKLELGKDFENDQFGCGKFDTIIGNQIKQC